MARPSARIPPVVGLTSPENGFVIGLGMRRALAILLLGAGACLARPGPADLHEAAEDAGAAPPAQHPSDLCAASDHDGDGFGTDPSCPEIDCDDTNPAIYPGAEEACNGIDDNCNHLIDEGLGDGTCGVGACMRTVPNCLDGHPAQCLPGMPEMEVCNGIDDDCDGVIDNGTFGAPCGVGACQRHPPCTQGHLGACVPGAPIPEVCNRIDDDCDGVVDNGFRAHVVNGTYTMLKSFAAACDGNGQRLGLECNSAMHRFCAQDGCTTSGFGPLENSGDVAVVGCVAAEPSIDVAYATLATYHASCEGSAEKMGPDCNAAIHRFCGAMGYASGFGPVEIMGDVARVTCLRSGGAEVVQTTYTALATQHASCEGTNERIGPDCNAAINRLCASMGHTTGFGPVENGGDNATITCVSP